MRTSHISPRGALGLALATAMREYESQITPRDQVAMLADIIGIRLALIDDLHERTIAGTRAMNTISQATIVRGK